MITSHLLYQTELSFVGGPIGIEPTPSGDPDALHELQIRTFLASAEYDTGDRHAPVGISASPNPCPLRRTALIHAAANACKRRAKNFLIQRTTCDAEATRLP